MYAEIETAEGWLTTHREHVAEGSHVEIDVFVRSLSPPLGAREQQERLLRQIRELQSRGIIDAYSVTLWGDGLCLCEACSETDAARSVLNRVEEFEQWADNNDLTLPIERRRVESKLLDTAASDLSVPSICLAVYTGPDLCGVVPCSVGTERISAMEYVEALAAESTSDAERIGQDTAAQT